MRLRTVLSLILIAAFGAGLAACGGGSVSSGSGSGSGGTGASSSIVVQSPRSASAFEYQGSGHHDTSLAAAISDFLISEALAQALEEVVLFDSSGNEVGRGTTDESGQIAFGVNSGTYYVCIGDPEVVGDPAASANCTPVSVDDDTVVLVTLDLVAGQLQAIVEDLRSEEAIVEDPESPGNADKLLICHKDMFTLSVARPAAVSGHMAHGDYHGPCRDTAGGGDDDNIESASDNGNNGRRGPPDNVGRPDNVGPPNGDDDEA